jgi:copper chaperone
LRGPQARGNPDGLVCCLHRVKIASGRVVFSRGKRNLRGARRIQDYNSLNVPLRRWHRREFPGVFFCALALVEKGKFCVYHERGKFMERIAIGVAGIHCQGCVNNVTGVLRVLPGVSEVKVSLEDACAEIAYDPQAIVPVRFREAIEGAGFDVTSGVPGGEEWRRSVQ